MSEQIKATLKAAVWSAISVLGEKKTREIIASIFNEIGDDWYNGRG